jgi:hypothetical protein
MTLLLHHNKKLSLSQSLKKVLANATTRIGSIYREGSDPKFNLSLFFVKRPLSSPKLKIFF